MRPAEVEACRYLDHFHLPFLLVFFHKITEMDYLLF